ncbi:hypothetical protein HanIR_Chr14g0683791 [Helianthus annuus]|nr:hypothetical protein HanIR_Chr14g0683791 [Helianthus annuus]
MGRKGKEIAGSSSQPEDTLPKRRRWLVLQRDIEEEEEEEEEPQHQQQHNEDEEDVVDLKPQWVAGSLDEQPERWQPALFHDKMNTLNDKREGFICEKEVREHDFGPLNVIKKFKALGWEAARQCYDRDDKNLFVDEIQEWMATYSEMPTKQQTITSEVIWNSEWH